MVLHRLADVFVAVVRRPCVSPHLIEPVGDLRIDCGVDRAGIRQRFRAVRTRVHGSRAKSRLDAFDALDAFRFAVAGESVEQSHYNLAILTGTDRMIGLPSSNRISSATSMSSVSRNAISSRRVSKLRLKSPKLTVTSALLAAFRRVASTAVNASLANVIPLFRKRVV